GRPLGSGVALLRHLRRAARRRLPPSAVYPHPAPAAGSSLSLHDALPIFAGMHVLVGTLLAHHVTLVAAGGEVGAAGVDQRALDRSEEHTSELQSRENLVCRLLLENKQRGLCRARGGG